ncbi:MAG: DUF4339 domain-containing protein [bacterium]
MNQWYVYLDDEVKGPYELAQLKELISESTLVCPAGSEDWVKAGEVEALQSLFTQAPPAKPVAPSEPKNINTKQKSSPKNQAPETASAAYGVMPTLNNLHLIARQASDDDLERELAEFWEEYDRAEQRIIRNEMTNRGIWPEEEESGEQSVL